MPPTRPSPPPTASLNEAEPVLGLPVERADALLPANLLHGDELIILLLKPSPLYVILACAGTLAIIAALVVAGLWIQQTAGAAWFEPRSAVTFGAALAAIRIGWQILEWIGRIYVLTDRRVIRQRNFFRPQIFQAELKHLQHTELLFSIRERLFGLGTIAFSTAGTGVPEAYWLMISHPIEIHRIVLQTISRYRG